MTAGRRGREDQRAQAKGGSPTVFSPNRGPVRGQLGGQGAQKVERNTACCGKHDASRSPGDGMGHGERWLSLGVLGSPERRAGDGTGPRVRRKVGRVRRLLPLGRCSRPPDLEEDVLWLPPHAPCLLVRSSVHLWTASPLPSCPHSCASSARGAQPTATFTDGISVPFPSLIRSTSHSKPPPPWRQGLCFPLDPWVWNTGSPNPLGHPVNRVALRTWKSRKYLHLPAADKDPGVLVQPLRVTDEEASAPGGRGLT